MLINGMSRKQVQRAALNSLINANTLAGEKVFEPRDWPTDPADFPLLLVATPRERKVGMYPGMAEFTTTISLVVIGRVVAATAEEAGDALDTLSGQIENALMFDPSFVSGIQQFVFIETLSTVDANGKDQIGEIGMTFELEIYQEFGPEGPPLTDVVANLQHSKSVPPIITDMKDRGRHVR